VSGRRRTIHTLHSTVGIAAHAADATSARPGEGSAATTPLGAFVRDAYAADCARFVAELKQRVAACAADLTSPPAAGTNRHL